MNAPLSPSTLKILALAAAREGTAQRAERVAQKAREAAERQLRLEADAQQRVHATLEQMMDKIKEAYASEEQRGFVPVMDVTADEYEGDVERNRYARGFLSPTQPQVNNLMLAARQVFQRLVEAGLEPRLEYTRRLESVESGNDYLYIVVPINPAV